MASWNRILTLFPFLFGHGQTNLFRQLAIPKWRKTLDMYQFPYLLTESPTCTKSANLYRVLLIPSRLQRYHFSWLLILDFCLMRIQGAAHNCHTHLYKLQYNSHDYLTLVKMSINQMTVTGCIGLMHLNNIPLRQKFSW